MKRLLSVLLVAVLALALFAGCNNATPSSSSTPSTSSEPATSSEPPSSSESDAEPLPELDTPTGSGTAEAKVSGYGGPIIVTLTVEKDVITEIKVNDEFETADIGGTAARTLEAAIVDSGNLEVDVVAGATVTSEAILLGCRQALAEIAAGN